jgi:hypothetical protein
MADAASRGICRNTAISIKTARKQHAIDREPEISCPVHQAADVARVGAFHDFRIFGRIAGDAMTAK